MPYKNAPVVISARALAPVEYKNGFKKPRGLFPAAISSSFSIAMTDAKMGELQPKQNVLQYKDGRRRQRTKN